jgi:hypothetical protein
MPDLSPAAAFLIWAGCCIAGLVAGYVLASLRTPPPPATRRHPAQPFPFDLDEDLAHSDGRPAHVKPGEGDL